MENLDIDKSKIFDNNIEISMPDTTKSPICNNNNNEKEIDDTILASQFNNEIDEFSFTISNIINFIIFSISLVMISLIFIFIRRDNLSWETELHNSYNLDWEKGFITDISFLDNQTNCNSIDNTQRWEKLELSSLKLNTDSCICNNLDTNLKQQSILTECSNHVVIGGTDSNTSSYFYYYYFNKIPFLKCTYLGTSTSEITKNFSDIYFSVNTLLDKTICVKRSSYNYYEITKRIQKDDKTSSTNNPFATEKHSYYNVLSNLLRITNLAKYFTNNENPIVDIQIVEYNEYIKNKEKYYSEYSIKQVLSINNDYKTIIEKYIKVEKVVEDDIEKKVIGKFCLDTTYLVLVKYRTLKEITTHSDLEYLISNIKLNIIEIDEIKLFTKSETDESKNINNIDYSGFSSNKEYLNNLIGGTHNRQFIWDDMSYSSKEDLIRKLTKNSYNKKFILRSDYNKSKNDDEEVIDITKISDTSFLNPSRSYSKLPLITLLQENSIKLINAISDYNNLSLTTELLYTRYPRSYSCLEFKTPELHDRLIISSSSTYSIIIIHLFIISILVIPEYFAIFYSKQQSIQINLIIILINLFSYLFSFIITVSNILSIFNFYVYIKEYKISCSMSQLLDLKINQLHNYNYNTLIIVSLFDLEKLVYYVVLIFYLCRDFIIRETEGSSYIKDKNKTAKFLIEEMMNLSEEDVDKDEEDSILADDHNKNDSIRKKRLVDGVIKKNSWFDNYNKIKDKYSGHIDDEKKLRKSKLVELAEENEDNSSNFGDLNSSNSQNNHNKKNKKFKKLSLLAEADELSKKRSKKSKKKDSLDKDKDKKEKLLISSEQKVKIE